MKNVLLFSLVLAWTLALLTGCGATAPAASGWAASGGTVGGWSSQAPEVSPAGEETESADLPPLVMVDGQLYQDTGRESTLTGRCGVLDGEITSAVGNQEVPSQNDQSNFGTGFGYQIGAELDTIEVYLNEKWMVFEAVEQP